MSFASISAMQQQTTRDAASVMVASKPLRNTRLQGQQALKLIESAVDAPPKAAGDGGGTLVSTYA